VNLVHRLCAAGFALSLTFAAAALGSSLLGHYGERADATLIGTSLSQNILRLVLLSMGGLLVLSNLGISITPLITALGVGSLAVALALQPTLSNLFAGVQISLAKPIRVGDFVELESGAKGYVEDIGWRYTRIRELPNNLVIVPNGRVAEMIVTNYALPEPEQAALVQLGVAYGSDLAKVERVTCEVAREVLREVEGGIPNFEPFIRYHTFGESSINFTVILRVKAFPDRFLITHEFIKRIKARYDSEGIEIPFPQRVVHQAAPETESFSIREAASGGGTR
jgi:small-conductance mechanosensitive channel